MEDNLLSIFKEAEKRGRKSLSIDALIFTTDIPMRTLFRRLKSLEEYGLIVKKTERPTSFWGIRGKNG